MLLKLPPVMTFGIVYVRACDVISIGVAHDTAVVQSRPRLTWRGSFFRVWAAICLFTFAAYSPDCWADPGDHQKLANRFRPFVKAETDEPYRPANWDWIVSHASVVSGYQPSKDSNCTSWGIPSTDDSGLSGGVPIWNGQAPTSQPADILNLPDGDLSANWAQGGAWGKDPAIYVLHLNDDSFKAGQTWEEAQAGAGMYAHVEDVDANFVNIEYSILWAYNGATCSWHHGDITSIVLVYDRGRDLISSVKYSVHGTSLMAISPINGSGKLYRLSGSPETPNAIGIKQSNSAKCVQGGGDHFNPTVCSLYLVQDPQTKRFDHPVVYAEKGSHELWPNNVGYEGVAGQGTPSHGGGGFSYLPSSVQMLGPADDPNGANQPLIHFSGKFGTDPNPIMLHRTWFYPAGRGNLPFAFDTTLFTDPDPYDPNSYLGWPPTRGIGDGDIAYLGPIPSLQRQEFALDDASRPFFDMDVIFSMLPSGGTIVLSAGVHVLRSNELLDRPVKFVVLGSSPAVLTRGNSDETVVPPIGSLAGGGLD